MGHPVVKLPNVNLLSLFSSFFLLQLVLSGPSAQAALRSVRVSSRTLSSVTVDMAPVSVNLVTRATPAMKVSTLSQCSAHLLLKLKEKKNKSASVVNKCTCMPRNAVSPLFRDTIMFNNQFIIYKKLT